VVASVAAGKVSWLPAHRFTAFPISHRDQWRWWKRCNCRYTVAGTVWAFHPTSLVALMGTCDGPTRRRRVEAAIAKLQRTGFSCWRGVTLCPSMYACQVKRRI